MILRRLGRFVAGLDGDKTSEALEGDVSIACSHDGRGTIAMRVELRAEPAVRRNPDWRAGAVLTIDAGSLDRLARAAKIIGDTALEKPPANQRFLSAGVAGRAGGPRPGDREVRQRNLGGPDARARRAREDSNL